MTKFSSFLTESFTFLSPLYPDYCSSDYFYSCI